MLFSIGYALAYAVHVVRFGKAMLTWCSLRLILVQLTILHFLGSSLASICVLLCQIRWNLPRMGSILVVMVAWLSTHWRALIDFVECTRISLVTISRGTTRSHIVATKLLVWRRRRGASNWRHSAGSIRIHWAQMTARTHISRVVMVLIPSVMLGWAGPARLQVFTAVLVHHIYWLDRWLTFLMPC